MLWQDDNIRRSILTPSFLLDGIRESREALFVPVPVHRVVPKDFGTHDLDQLQHALAMWCRKATLNNLAQQN